MYTGRFRCYKQSYVLACALIGEILKFAGKQNYKTAILKTVIYKVSLEFRHLLSV